MGDNTVTVVTMYKPLVLPGLRQRLFKDFVLTKGAKIVID